MCAGESLESAATAAKNGVIPPTVGRADDGIRPQSRHYSRSISFGRFSLRSSGRMRLGLFPDVNLGRAPHAPALVAAVGLGAEFSRAHC